jgi:hypothetical protein
MTVPSLFNSSLGKQIPQSDRGPLFDDSTRMCSPISASLILGSHDAVLGR